jgi:hypothetical protein
MRCPRGLAHVLMETGLWCLLGDHQHLQGRQGIHHASSTPRPKSWAIARAFWICFDRSGVRL